MRRYAPTRPKALLTVVFTMLVFAILVITMCIVGCAVYLLMRAGIVRLSRTPADILLLVATLAITSITVGTIVALLVGRIPLKPLNRLISGMNRLAGGDYATRIGFGGSPIGHEISESFNTLAAELQNTEMLRADFVNNFSHEFKTPIVSIRGFAKLLRKGGLPDEQRDEYLDIIVSESTRLADMATNVLNLTKVENQSILTDVTRFNLSEQLRDCVLLLEKKWTEKRLSISVAFGEHEIAANEELLRQVWINLLDNAVKFSPEGGEIAVTIGENAETLTVCVQNHGPAITAEELPRIFDKFWQGDPSHAVSGTGIGLSVVKRVAELHKGRVEVESTPRATRFCVTLPKA